jgi:hypothetical protein
MGESVAAKKGNFKISILEGGLGLCVSRVAVDHFHFSLVLHFVAWKNLNGNYAKKTFSQ